MASTDERVGRWRRLDETGGSRSVRRWRGVDEEGGPADLLRPQVGPKKSGELRDFARAHRAVAAGSDPALVDVYEVIETQIGVDVARAPLHDATVADVKGLLAGDLIAAIGAHLAPAVLEVGAALGGTLLPQDVGLDANGWVVLAPLGPHTSHVERSVAGAAAPESFEGEQPDGRSALYGLGVVLYRLATGRVPPTGAAPATPSALNHRVSAQVDRAILRLLSPDPNQRPGAIPELLAAAGSRTDLRGLTGQAETRASMGALAPRTPRTEGHPLVIPTEMLAELSPSQRSLAAGIAGLPLAALDELIQARLPLVVARPAAWGEERESWRERVRSELGVSPIDPRSPTLGPVAWGLAGVVGAGLPIAVGLALTPLVGWLALAPGAVVGAGLGGVALWQLVGASRSRSGARDAESAWQIQERGRAERAQWAPVAAVDERIARIRQDLAHADLPVSADADVRDALKELEARLDAIIVVLQTAERALGAVDRARLATRLTTLEQSGRPELADARDQAARTAADLAAVASRRDAQLAEIHAIEGALDELAASLVPDGRTSDGGELERLRRTSQLLRRREHE